MLLRRILYSFCQPDSSLTLVLALTLPLVPPLQSLVEFLLVPLYIIHPLGLHATNITCIDRELVSDLFEVHPVMRQHMSIHVFLSRKFLAA